MAYNPQSIEPKWQAFWEENKTFRAEIDQNKEKYYALDMFPYPSAAGLHVGHPEGYTATDIVSRYKRMKGFNVLHCMGWDAFGLPAEQHALQTGTHPAETTQKNVNTFKRQIKSLGFSYDWDREINTTDPKYYKWTQWIFMQLYKQDLAYQQEAPVNWCPALGTVLANEEVVNGVSERGGHPVERRPMKQWMLKITEYAEKLLNDLDEVDWADSIKEMQRNWIGKSHGARARFNIAGYEDHFDVFTTRPDTLFGATYCVFAPEHPLVQKITTSDQKEAVESYVKECSLKSDLDRTDLAKEKTGVFTGAFAVNPVNNQKIPIWIADYVLLSYGTGAIMAVPGHDVRDHEFAKTFDLPIIQVVDGVDSVDEEAYPAEGTAMNSDFLNGLKTAEAKEKMISWLEEKELGEGTINYKLRDWLFSRQRYWGEPFPLIETEEGDIELIDESELPLLLPETENYKPSPSGESPLANVESWINITMPDGKKAKRNSNTMPQWAGSCWYYLRFTDPDNDQEAWSKEAEKYWMPVDLYIGGAEHAVLHLLYSRFWHKVLYDQGYVSTKEPFQKLVNQGMILGEDNRKMSKSIGNVINPDVIVKKYGADSMRLYEMFMGPLQKEKPWQTNGLEGVHKFLSRVWNLIVTESGDIQGTIQDIEPEESQLKLLHKSIKKISQDTEELKFNTAISQMMIFLNEISSEKVIAKSIVKTFVLLLAPYAPHLAEELWNKLGETNTLTYEPWPSFDESLTQENEFEVPIQVNGKLRDKIMMPVGLSQDDAYKLAEASAKIQKYLEGKTVRKVIFIKNRILNIVVS